MASFMGSMPNKPHFTAVYGTMTFVSNGYGMMLEGLGKLVTRNPGRFGFSACRIPVKKILDGHMVVS